MSPYADIENVAASLLNTCNLTLTCCKVLQTLWAGYGHICSVEAITSENAAEKTLSLILKYVSPPVISVKSRDEGHLRKVISYQVEQYFYTHLAPKMPREIAVASCLASVDHHNATGNITALIMTDLRGEFPVAGERCRELSEKQVSAATDWLAGFHGFWWKHSQDFAKENLRRPPLEETKRTLDHKLSDSNEGGVWLNGGYTYLATRMKEYADLAEDDTSEWAPKLCPSLKPNDESLAERVARFLAPLQDRVSAISDYETLIHGDVKSENLFTTTKGDAVAFFDFQYVGLGLGVCDLAKLFTCSLPEAMLYEGADDGLMHSNEEQLLRRYLDRLISVSGKQYEWDTFVRHWEVALVDWLRFQASWGFWGNTEWLEARVRTILDDQDWKHWLDESLSIKFKS